MREERCILIKLIENPIVRAIAKWLWELFLAMLQTACLVGVVLGAVWIATTRETKPVVAPNESGDWLNVLFDETQLVRCKSFVDRGSCVQFVGCEDKVERCVLTFEILRRPIGPADYLPTEGND